MGQLCCFPFSRDEEKISELRSPNSAVLQGYRSNIAPWQCGKKPVIIMDLIKEALLGERMGVLSKVKQIKELLSKPDIEAQIKRELFDVRLSSNDTLEKNY
ncbi:A-kinase anchor protein 7 isoforms alpha and beta-like [Phascolarctos cinereus]